MVEQALGGVRRLVADRFGVDEPLLYARVDAVTADDGRIEVLEVELAEPSFFLPPHRRRPGRSWPRWPDGPPSAAGTGSGGPDR